MQISKFAIEENKAKLAFEMLLGSSSERVNT
jgi:hypothetical protein